MKMISSNFAVAVVTVVLRGLVDKAFAAFQAPPESTSILPKSSGIILLSGTLYLLYYHIRNKRHLKFTHSGSERRSKILDGRIHKDDSVRGGQHYHPHKFRSTHSRSRSRCRANLHETVRNSVDILRQDCSSSEMGSFKSVSTSNCRRNNENIIQSLETKERSPSLYSIKSDMEEGKIEATNESNIGNTSMERCEGYGDCKWNGMRTNLRKRRKIQTTRKTRSGKTYSLYL